VCGHFAMANLSGSSNVVAGLGAGDAGVASPKEKEETFSAATLGLFHGAKGVFGNCRPVSTYQKLGR
jgi:hypothetical protein